LPQSTRFWEKKSLDSLSDDEWESLCDGCGRCCLQKLEDEDSGEVLYTNIACELLDGETCRCSDYANRFERVVDCLSVRPLTEKKLTWLPPSCAYRRLAEGRSLAPWHPLISGDPDSVHQAGISMTGSSIPESKVALVEFHRHVIRDFDD